MEEKEQERQSKQLSPLNMSWFAPVEAPLRNNKWILGLSFLS
jgi:hypothetical protein